MHTTVQKWGNSLAVRIPKPFVEEIHIASGSEVDLTVDDGRIIIVPQPEAKYSLTELLQGVTARNRHSETDTGTAVGQEVW
jgi:antitoxin MazE